MNVSFDKKLDEMMNQLKQLNDKKCKKAVGDLYLFNLKIV